MQAMLQTSRHQAGHYTVLGLGISGSACVDYLCRQGLPVMAWDTRDNPPGLAELQQRWPELKVRLGDFSFDALLKSDVIVISPGLNRRTRLFQRLQQAGVRIIGELELFAEALAFETTTSRPQVLAVTGSNGKSTVVTLLGEMAVACGINAAVGGNLGTPALQLLQQQADCYILELSSFQLESCPSLHPDFATVLNVSADHMDRYDGLDDYRKTKQRLQLQARTVIADRAQLDLWKEQARGFQMAAPRAGEFGLQMLEGREWIVFGAEPWVAVDSLKPAPRTMLFNALAALSMGHAAGWPKAGLCTALQNFSGLPHRAEWLGEANGIAWVNDSKGTNPGATAAAIAGMQRPVILIAGGQSKQADMRELRPELQDHVKQVLLIGEDAPLLNSAWNDIVSCEICSTLTRAVTRATQLAEPGDVVLLSPACASFDQFKGFADRGQQFAALAQSYMAQSQRAQKTVTAQEGQPHG